MTLPRVVVLFGTFAHLAVKLYVLVFFLFLRVVASASTDRGGRTLEIMTA